MKRLFLKILIVSLLLSGCGFRLHQKGLSLKDKYPIMEVVPSGSHALSQSLRQALLAQQIEITQAPPGSAHWILRIDDERFEHLPLAYGPDSEMRRERILLSVRFGFGLSPVLRPITFHVQRDRLLNNKQHLGDNAELLIIEHEMRQDLIHQLLSYLHRKRYDQPR